MISLQERYSELLALTKRYLIQEYSLNDRILSEPDTYSYFRAYALQNQKNKSQPSIPKTENLGHKRPEPSNLSKTGTVPSTFNMNAEHVDPKRDEKSVLHKSVTNQSTPSVEIKKSGLQELDKLDQNPKIPNVDIVPPNQAVTSFKLDLPPAAPLMDFTELRKIIREKLPHLNLLDPLPDDSEAKELANTWTKEKQAPQVLILSFDEPPKHQLFLANIAKALKIDGLHAVVTNAIKIERNQEWQKILQSKDLKLIVASSSSFYNLPELQKNYREGTKQGRHYLGEHLLLLLSDVGFYLKEPALKPSLWGALKELLAAAASK